MRYRIKLKVDIVLVRSNPFLMRIQPIQFHIQLIDFPFRYCEWICLGNQKIVQNF